MNKKLLYSIAISILFLGFTTTTHATHIMGGSVSYQYLGLDSATGGYNYQVTLELFRLCDPGSAQLPLDMNLGVYQDDSLNPGGDKLLVIATTLPLIIQQPITPPAGNASCAFTPNVCVEEGIYQGIVTLPASNNGYYFISDRCCRNNTIANLNNPGMDGEAYFAYAPPPSVVNSSPTFAVVPVPFICSNDTVSVLNQAFDPDGDLLIYHFATPYNGLSNGGNPNPNPPVTYTWPIPTVTYAAPGGYGYTTPFGTAGYASIDSTTGLAHYYSPTQGFYVVAVEIYEYRNGVLIGISRRDIQIIVIPCPVNPAPALSSSTLQTTYTLQEGDTLCFNNTFIDSNGDSIFISHTGNIFNISNTNPAATYVDASGDSVATGQFCWMTSCDQGNAVPYQFTVIATDNGCPAKITNIVYTVNVVNTPKPVAVFGPDTLCLVSNPGYIYSIVPDTNYAYTYNWIVSNATIIGPSTGDSITVSFSGTGSSIISVYAVNKNGCSSDTLDQKVFLNAVPTAVAGPDVSFCSGSSATIGTTPTGGFTYLWNPSVGLSSSTVAGPTVTLTNSGSTPISTTYIVTTSSSGCSNTDTVVVTVNPTPPLSAGPDVIICSGNSATIGLPSVAGYTYTWTPSTGLSSTIIADPTVTLINNLTVPVIYHYTLTVQNSYLCSSVDSVAVTVNPVPTAVAGNDTSFCSGSSVVIGGASTAGFSYSWNPTTGLSSGTASNPTLTLTNVTGQNDTLYYVVTAGFSTCIDRDTIQIIVRPNPISNAGSNQFFCSGGTVQLGTSSTGGYTYNWTPATGLSDSTISNPTLTLSNAGPTPDTLIYIVTTTLNGCVTSDTVQIINSPVPTAIAGPDMTYCSGSSVVIGSASSANYNYSWSPTTGLSSSTISNPTVTVTNITGVNDTLTYILTTNLFGCTDADTVQVIVRPNPISNAGLDQFFCSGGTVQLGTASTAGYSYSWTPATGLSSTTISNPTLTLSNSGPTPDTLIYIVTTTLNGCVTSDTVQIINSPVPTAVAGPDVVYCSGNTAVIGSASSTNYTYNWTPSTGLSSSTISNPTVTVTNATGVNDTLTYILTTNLFGCTDADTVQVIVKPTPVSVAGQDTTLCGGSILVLGTSTTAGYTYNWTPSTGLSSTTISNPTATLSNNGNITISITYTVTTDLNGCSSTDNVTVIINPQPVVAASASPTSLCIGASSTLTAVGATGYSWALSTSPGTSISTDSTLTVNPTSTTTYILTGSNGFGCSNTDTVTITVNPLPAVQITAPNDTICNGDSLLLTATGASSYTWSILGGATIGNGPTIQVSPSSNTTYVVVGTNANLCSNSDTINISVNPAATLAGANGTLSVCPGVTGVLYWVTNPNPTSTYTWTVTNGTIVSGQNTDTIVVNWPVTSGSGLVSVFEVTDHGCMSPPFNLPITINVFLTPVAPTGPTTLCALQAQGQIYTTLFTNGSTYSWFTQGGTIVSGNNTNTVTVDWTVPGPQTVLLWYQETSITSVDTCFGSSDTLTITINPSPGTSPITGPAGICVLDSGNFSVTNTVSSTYNWSISSGTILAGNGTNTISASWTGGGTATISVVETNSYGCVGNAVSYNVSVHPLPNADAGLDTSVCIGQGVQLGASGGVIFSWSPAGTLSNANSQNPIASPTSATTYTVLVTDTNGCKNTDSVLVAVNALPVITLTPNSPVCIGNSIQLNANAANANTYIWSPAGTLSNTNIFNPIATPTQTITYTVIVSNNNTCVDSAHVTITVNPLPTIVASTDTTICAGSSATLVANGGTSYSWSPASSLNSSTASSPVATPQSQTTYTVTGTDANGCSNTDQVTVLINPQPQASFKIDDANLAALTCSGYTGILINTSTEALNYLWQFPDGTTSTAIDPQVQLNLSGNNTITLTAVNNMCNDTAVVDFASTAIGQLYSKLPNVFSPNGDGINDCYDFGKTFNLDNCSSWEVFDRWGNKVFQSSSAHPCWNGKKDGTGKDLSDGTYYIIVKIAGQTYHGSITLIR
jgi:gliding motility-associated-like protein